MNAYLKIYLTLIIALTGFSSAFAQEERPAEEGEVIEGEFEINKELEIVLPSAQRVFEKVPPSEFETKEVEPLQYSFGEFRPELPDITTRLRVLKLKTDKITVKPSSYIKLGFGNYLTPLIDIGINSGPNKTGNIGARLYFLGSNKGPVDKQNSGDSHTAVSLYGKHIGGKASISGELGYQRDAYHFYGYDTGIKVDRDTIKQAFNDLSLGINIKSHDITAPIRYSIFANAYSVSDKYDANELGFRTGLAGSYILNDEMGANLEISYLFNNYKNPNKINRSLFRIYPSFTFTLSDFSVVAGFKVATYNDTLNNKKNTRVFPSVKLVYDFSDNISAYGILDGDVEEVTFRGLIRENPYLNQNASVNHTLKSIDVNAGVKGSLAQYLGFDAGIQWVLYKNLYFYVNDTVSFNKFNVVYDEGTTSLFRFYGSLSYTRGQRFGGSLLLRYNGYTTGKIDKAWHRPKFETDISFWYNFYDKVKLYSDFFVLSGITAVDYRPDIPVVTTLSAVADLNLRVEYVFSDKYNMFISVNNIFSNNYQIYNRYRVRGLLAMVGLSVSF